MYKIVKLNYKDKQVELVADFETIVKFENILNSTLHTWVQKKQDDGLLTVKELYDFLSLYIDDEKENKELFILENRMDLTATFLSLIKEMIDPDIDNKNIDNSTVKKNITIIG